MSRDYSSGQLVGIDLHRRRSVICRMSAEGEVLESVRIDSDRAALLREVSKAGPGAPVAIEATYGWYWAVDTLHEHGFQVHLAHPKGLASFQGRRVKTDWADAKELVDLLRLGGSRRPTSPRWNCASCVSWCVTATSWSRSAPPRRPACMRCSASAG